jgi:hypothetical protein
VRLRSINRRISAAREIPCARAASSRERVCSSSR